MSTGLIVAIGVGVLILVLAAAAVLIFRWMTGRPMYNPGDLQAGKNLRPPPAQPGDPDYWTVEEDIKLYHFSAGSGRNVLMIHGGPGYPFLEPWTGLEALTSDYRFHYYDQRGCGRSTRPIDTLTESNTYKNIQTLEGTLGIGAHLADIERIRQILGDEQLILIGQSFGGFMAALYAAEFPNRVQAMVLSAPADMLLMPPAHGGLFEEVQKRLPSDMQASYSEYMDEYFNFKGLFDKSEKEMAAFNDRFKNYYGAAYDLSIQDQAGSGGWMVQAQYFSLGKQHDYRYALTNIAVTTLVIHGADDFQTEAVGQMYVDILPNARMEVIPNAGHFSYEEQPEAFGVTVSSFLDELK